MSEHKCSKCGATKSIMTNSKGIPYVGCPACKGKPAEGTPPPKERKKEEGEKKNERWVDHWL